jgi:hypothetical protein
MIVIRRIAIYRKRIAIFRLNRGRDEQDLAKSKRDIRATAIRVNQAYARSTRIIASNRPGA